MGGWLAVECPTNRPNVLPSIVFYRIVGLLRPGWGVAAEKAPTDLRIQKKVRNRSAGIGLLPARFRMRGRCIMTMCVQLCKLASIIMRKKQVVNGWLNRRWHHIKPHEPRFVLQMQYSLEFHFIHDESRASSDHFVIGSIDRQWILSSGYCLGGWVACDDG